MKLSVPFAESGFGTLALVGGKGHNLVNLVQAGFPVPPGFVVTADAYRKFVESLDWLEAELQSFDFDDPARLADQCAALRRRLAGVKLPDDVSNAIGDSLSSLKLDASARFAVRSSSTLEDLAQAAFAGQHDTYLNVRSPDVVDKVRDCFVSLWGDRAVLYRHHQGFAQLHARMAVVIQRQIECDRAGVGFSVDPVTGNLRQMVIDANYGLGESVVAGECEVDHILLDKTTMNVISQSIGQKDRMIVPTADGTEEKAVDVKIASAPCLNDEEIAAVGQLLARVESHYGWPQDIEWGLKDGQLYLFQSRAVTTLQPRYTRDESAERFPKRHDAALVGFSGRRVPPVAGPFAATDGPAAAEGGLVHAHRPLRLRQSERRRAAWPRTGRSMPAISRSLPLRFPVSASDSPGCSSCQFAGPAT